MIFHLARYTFQADSLVVETTTSLTYRSYGSPEEVLELATHDLPPVGPKEVKLRMLAAPINPSDYG
jgi:NADPH:quinone reductase-like Zn-dependent oxidoreductase